VLQPCYWSNESTPPIWSLCACVCMNVCGRSSEKPELIQDLISLTNRYVRSDFFGHQWLWFRSGCRWQEEPDMINNQSPNDATMFLTVTVILNPIWKEEIHPKNPWDYISCPWSSFFSLSAVESSGSKKENVCRNVGYNAWSLVVRCVKWNFGLSF